MIEPRRLHDTVAFGSLALLLAILALAAWRFSGHGELASLADDSATYVVMAKYFSPYSPPDEVIDYGYRQEVFPPLFPLLLAITGGGEDLRRAHQLVLACLLLACAVLYLMARHRLEGPWTALGVTAAFAASPAVWLNMLGILSENLYLALSLGTILFYQRNVHPLGAGGATIMGSLLAACLLSRTAAIALVLAYAVHALTLTRGSSTSVCAREVLPALVTPLLAYLSWLTVKPDVPYSYLEDLVRFYQLASAEGITAPLLMVQENLIALVSAWLTSFSIFWTDQQAAQPVIAALLGALTLYGTARRLRKNTLDGWYLVFYLLVILIWPYPSHMERFLYAVLPLLILNAFDGSRALARMAAEKLMPWAPVLTLGLFATLSLPALAFIHGRADYRERGLPYPYRYIAELYRHPDLSEARRIAGGFGRVMEDLQAIRAIVPLSAVVLWVKPNFMELLGERRSMLTPVSKENTDFARELLETGADYVFISPVTARKNGDGLELLDAVQPFSDIVWARRAPDSRFLETALMRIRVQDLEQLAPTHMPAD